MTRRQQRLRGSLVVAEVALALVLLVGAGLFVRSFLGRIAFDPGFDARHLVKAEFAFPPGQALASDQINAFHREILDRVNRLPGVQHAAIVSTPPPFHNFSSPLGLPVPAEGDPPRAVLMFTSERFMEMLGIRVTAGRGLSLSDVAASRNVGVVNETLAKRYFGNRSPLGQSVRIDRLSISSKAVVADSVFEIVGVVQDVANRGTSSRPPDPEVYLPYTINASGRYLLVRSSSSLDGLVAAMRQQVGEVNPQAALRNAELLRDWGLWGFPRDEQFSTIVLVLFAVTGLTLVGLGVYGVIAYTVSQQTREFAIRLALGGERRHVLSQVCRMTLWLVGAGTVIGLGAGLATGRLIASQLTRTSPYDPLTFATAIGVVAIVGAVACAVPARNAMRVEPATALRHE